MVDYGSSSPTSVPPQSPVVCDHLVEMGERLCLVCLQANLDYCSVTKKVGQRSVSEILCEIVAVPFAHVDANFPQDICITCLRKLLELVDFKHQIQDSIKLFQTGVQFVTVAEGGPSPSTVSGYSTEADVLDEVNDLLRDDVILSCENVLVEEAKKQESGERETQTKLDSELLLQSDSKLSFGQFIENLKKSTITGPVPLRVREDWTMLRQCQTCEKPFKTVKEKEKHMRRDHSLKFTPLRTPRVCPTCNKSFKSINGLKFHIATIHSDKRPFRCEHPGCTRAFAVLKDLKAHSASHRTTIEAICDECSRQFTSKELFRRHFLNVHAKRRKWKCPECPRAFVLQDTLRSHMVSHQDRPVKLHKCTFEGCQKSYGWRSDLVKHEKTHYGLFAYPCSLCPKGYSCSSNLKLHLQEIHKLSDEEIRALKGKS